jgi:2-methylcitrate dehydratase
MDNITKEIADFAAGLTFPALDGATVHAATQRLVDTLGCALGAFDCEPARIGRRVAAGQGAGHYAGYVLGYGDRLPAESATFINSALIRNFDFNDRYPGGHPSDGLGALLALAGTREVDGRRFLTAMCVLYEIFARLSDSARLSRRGWDQGFAIGVSTAAGVCNLLGLPQATTANAIGIVASSSVPLRVTRSGELSPWKNAATAYAARNGIFAALLAAEGMAGPGSAFAGRAGLFENVTGPFELEPFPNRGGPALTPDVQIKYWPIETNGQPAVWAALALRDKIAWQDLADIEILTNKFTWYEIGSEPEKWDPKTHETADHSLPYIFARTLVDGPLTIASFRHEAVLDPALRPLMAKIRITIDDAIEALLPNVKMEVRATAHDGNVHTVEVGDPLGHPDNPMQDKDIAAKFSTLVEPVLGHERCAAALAAWWCVREAGDIRTLIKLLDVKPG